MSRAEGFAQVPIWMIRERIVPRNAILVYASLSSRSGLGEIFPSQATIAEESGLSERTVRTMLGHLEALGVIHRERRTIVGSKRATDAYTLHPNGRPGLAAELAGRAEQADLPADLPATEAASTGNQAHLTPLIEVDREEVDRGNAGAEIDARLDALWGLWPASRRSTRKVVERSLRGALKAADWLTIIDAAQSHTQVWATWPASEIHFVPLLSTWLNQERWTGAPPQPRVGRTLALSTVEHGRRVDQILAEQEQARLAVTA